jgi:hypothetical protein
VKNRFQNLPFKRHLQRYSVERFERVAIFKPMDE